MAEHIDMLCKDAFAITSRLFDHRAVVRAESKYIVRELETKKSRESSKTCLDILLSADKTKCRINECVDLLNERLKNLHSLVITAASDSLDILHDESDKHKTTRMEYKRIREQEWEVFMKEMNKAQAEVLQKHEESIQKLEAQQKIEQGLNIP